MSCEAKLDLCLIIDSSGSIRDNNPSSGNPDNWALQLDFLANVVASFPIGPDNTRVAAIVFSDDANFAFPLNEYHNLVELQGAIRSLAYMGAATNTGEAFRVAGSRCFSDASGDRGDVDNVIIIVTDENPFPYIRRTPALTEARRLRDNGVEILAVGIMGMYRSLDEDFLRGISSGNNYLTVAIFDQLETVRELLLDLACPTSEYSLTLSTSDLRHWRIRGCGDSLGPLVFSISCTF